MKYSELFGKTRREAPAELAQSPLGLAYRAGLLRTLRGEQVVYLPLASRVLEKMRTALRQDLQELRALALHAAQNPDLSDLAAREIQSYKQLPARLFWYGEGATQLHLAALEANRAAADETRRRFDDFVRRLFEWAQVPCATAENGNGRVWYTPAARGDLELLFCSKGDYVATRAAARANKPGAGHEELRPAEQVATPHCDTIDSLAQFLGVPTSRTAKAVFYASGGRVIFAVVRGDLQIDEAKLKRALGLGPLRFATDDEIRRVGATPGYASPVGIRGATLVVDDSIADSPNLVAGANREGYHLLNTNVPRDYRPDRVEDIALARAGDLCPDGDGKLEAAHGISLGWTGQPAGLSSSFLDANGRPQQAFGLQLEMDLAQIMLAFIETHHDEKGIIWSRDLAPFALHLVALNADKPEVGAALDRLTRDLEQAGVNFLLDDRAESAGVKFNDADLIGLPLRLTIGPRTVAQASVELKRRDEPEARMVPLDQATDQVAS